MPAKKKPTRPKPQAQQVAIVTGGAHGIGLSTAQHLVAAGWAVVLADIDKAAGRKAAAWLAASGDAIFIQTDVSDEPSVRRLVRATLKHYGRLDGLVNNAAQG